MSIDPILRMIEEKRLTPRVVQALKKGYSRMLERYLVNNQHLDGLTGTAYDAAYATFMLEVAQPYGRYFVALEELEKRGLLDCPLAQLTAEVSHRYQNQNIREEMNHAKL